MTGTLGTLGGDGGNSFPFDTVGDTIKGKVRSVEKQQQTDMESGEPAFWPGGKPKEMYAVGLATDLRDEPGDDGMRMVFLKGSTKPESKSSLAAVRVAVKGATGAYDLQYDAELTLAYVDTEAPATRGFSPRKLYASTYVPAVMSIGEAPGPTTPPAPPAAATPAASAPAATATDPLAGFTPEQRAAIAALAPAAPAWDADPRVAQLRGMGIADDAIRTTLGI